MKKIFNVAFTLFTVALFIGIAIGLYHYCGMAIITKLLGMIIPFVMFVFITSVVVKSMDKKHSTHGTRRNK